MNTAVLLGRMQPPHKGHMAIIDEMLIEGYKPIIILGGANKVDARHPYDTRDIIILLTEIYGNRISIRSIRDYDDWDEWWANLKTLLPGNSVIFINNKEQDRINFSLGGKEYHNAFYNDMWHDLNFETHQVTFPEKLGISHINATDIRNDIEGMKWAVHPAVYKYITSGS